MSDKLALRLGDTTVPVPKGVDVSTMPRVNFDKGSRNVGEDAVLEQMRRNLRMQWPQLAAFRTQDAHVALVGGGWSLKDNIKELRKLTWGGVPIFAMNGAGKYLDSINIRTQALLLMDGREDNTVFVEDFEPPGCHYYIASQCHSKVFEALDGRSETYIWHTPSEDSAEGELLKEFYGDHYVSVPGGSTVGLRSIVLLRILGFRFLHIFGMDSCFDPRSGAHHSYDQPLNDDDKPIRFVCADRVFFCAPWMGTQAQHFRQMVPDLLDDMKVQIYGDGLLKHLLNTGAELLEDDQDGG